MPFINSISISSFSSLFSTSYPPSTAVTTTTTTATSPPPPPLRKPPVEAVELRQVFRTMGIQIPNSDLATMISRVDSNDDGCVDSDEFRDLYREIMAERGIDDEDKDIKEAFDVFDANKDGFISPEELRSALAELGLRRPHGGVAKVGEIIDDDDCRLMITKVDLDGDGLVSFVEFKRMMMRGNTDGFGLQR